MSLLMLIPWLDIFLGLLFLGLVALGFWQGLLKELWFLISLYLGAILASLYGDLLGKTLEQAIGSGSPAVASAWGFFIVLVVATAILFAIISLLVGHVRLRSSLLVFDKIGGITLGVITAFVIVSFIAFILNAVLAISGPAEWAFVGALRAQRLTSPLMRLFLSTRTVVLTAIVPWLPELPRFLSLE